MNRTKTEYNKKIYIGFSVLEISKWKIYSFRYDYIKPKNCEILELNYMDTDSFIYDIKTDDLYSGIKNYINIYFDTSAYSKDNQYFFFIYLNYH